MRRRSERRGRVKRKSFLTVAAASFKRRFSRAGTPARNPHGYTRYVVHSQCLLRRPRVGPDQPMVRRCLAINQVMRA